MCPAQVYEIPEDEVERTKHAANDVQTKVTITVTPSNCIQCGVITARGGRLTPPEGGDGPNYQQT
jgi:electron-transferring-flavoprotein dehydrogenase